MALIDDIKTALRISNTAYNSEITDLIAAAKADLALSGVLKVDETDTLIKRAITTYAKANFGLNNPDSEKLMNSYDMIKSHLSLSGDYGYYAITFSVTKDAVPVEDAYVTFNGQTIRTNSLGIAIFKGVSEDVNQAYTVVSDSSTEAEIDVTASATINVTMG